MLLITLMCNCGHVQHVVHVHEPLRWVGRVSMGQKLFNLPILALKLGT